MTASGSEVQSALSVRQLNESIQAALGAAFPDPVWVKGEVQRLPHDAARRKHVYFELHDGGREGAARYQMPAAILGWDRDRFGLGRYLDGSDPAFRLQDKLEVCVLCRVEFYPPFGKVNVRVVGIDTEFSLGQLEAQRRRVMAWLKSEGLLELNQAISMSGIPLKVGLVTSRGSAAERDFRTGLQSSPYRFEIELVDSRMQGEQTAPQVTAALKHLARSNVDVIVITRGGGSRADLSWFDQQDLCEAVARCQVPVVTAIGHEIDTSLVDLCGHTRCKTPTAAAEFLVERVRHQDERVARLAEQIHDLSTQAVVTAGRRLQTATDHLETRTQKRVARHEAQLHGQVLRVVAGLRHRAAAARREADYLAQRAGRETIRVQERARARLDRAAGSIAAPAIRRMRQPAAALAHLSEKVRLLDPVRVLERGFTLTVDGDGRPLRRVADAQPGQLLRTRFADGEVQSTVHGSSVGKRRTSKPKGDRDGTKEGSGSEKDPGQQALF